MGEVEKRQLYEFVSRVGKAVANPKRLELLDLLCQGGKTVDQLAGEAGLAVKLTSAHLQDLKDIGLVEGRRDGKCVRYRIADPNVTAFWVTLRNFALGRISLFQEMLTAFQGGHAGLTPIDRASLLKRAQSGDVVVIDVRPHEEFVAGHFPGARSVPLNELKKLLKTLPKNKEVVAYCRGPYCLLSKDAVDVLARRGFKATRITEGVSEWVAHGVPIERGTH